MIGLVHDAHTTKRDTVGYHGSQELIVIAGHEYDLGTALGMTQDPAYHVGVALTPAPSVLLDFPGIYDVSHQIELIRGVVLEEVV